MFPEWRRGYLARVRQALLLCLALAGLGGLGPALAADIAGFEREVVLKAREQPVARFLDDLFGQIDVPVVIDESITGSVNGDFEQPASAVFEAMRASFQLTLYFDGAVAYVYPASETSRKVIYVDNGVSQRVLESAHELALIDERNSLSRADVGLVATGTQRFHEQVQELSDAVRDQVTGYESPETYRVFKLRYGWAEDITLVVGGQELVVPGVVSLLRTLVDPGALQVPAGTQRSQLSPTRPGLRGEGLQSVGTDATPTQAGAEAGLPELSPEAAQIAGELQRSQAAGGGAGDSTRTRIVADSLHNSVVVRDRADRMDGYAALIESLDTEPMMIEIEATIIDMNTDRLRELGVNWRAQRKDDEILLGSGNESDALLQENTQVTPIGEGGIVSLVLGDSTKFISRIQALENQGAARIVSKPHVITLANVEALLDNTETFFVRVEGQEEVDLFDVSVGTTLRVTPHVFEVDGASKIKLLVNIEDGSTSDQRVDEIPIVKRSSINTQAIVNESQSLLIGGLIRETTQNGVSKVPVLGDIPLVGALFRSSSKSSTQSERLFLITPRLTRNPVDGPTQKRFDGPVLSGSESDILESAPSRMETARAGVNGRDERYPPPKQLPQGQGTPGLKTDEPAREAEKPGSTESDMRATRAPNLAERLDAWQATGSVDAPSPSGQQAVSTDKAEPSRQESVNAADGWVPVRSATPSK